MDAGLSDAMAVIISVAPFFMFIFGIFIFWIFAFFLLYHFMRFGVGTAPKKVAFVFLVGALIIFIFVVIFFVQIDTEKLLEQFTGELTT
jgi:hypothetical protein